MQPGHDVPASVAASAPNSATPIAPAAWRAALSTPADTPLDALSTLAATELADLAGVTRSIASAHLARLLAGGPVRVEARGRHRYYALAGTQVADALEALTLLRPPTRKPPGGSGRRGLAGARTGYRHLAGRLGVAWFGALEHARIVTLGAEGVEVTRTGARKLGALGFVTDGARWPAGKPCLDWTERRYHLGGPLGTWLTDELFRLKWIVRRGEGRGVRVTARGRDVLARTFALVPEP